MCEVIEFKKAKKLPPARSEVSASQVPHFPKTDQLRAFNELEALAFEEIAESIAKASKAQNLVGAMKLKGAPNTRRPSQHLDDALRSLKLAQASLTNPHDNFPLGA